MMREQEKTGWQKKKRRKERHKRDGIVADR